MTTTTNTNALFNVCHQVRLCVSACVDNLGRVLLIDMNDGTVLRMLKGYRDAQVG
jgi:hypothetical protein